MHENPHTAGIVYDTLNAGMQLKVYGENIKEVNAPVTERNLTGIYWNATNAYEHMSGTSLAMAHIDAFKVDLSSEEYIANPFSYRRAIDKIYLEWANNRIYEKMTKDLYWSIWYIRAIPEAPDKAALTDSLMETFNNFMRSPPANPSEMMLFNLLKDQEAVFRNKKINLLLSPSYSYTPSTSIAMAASSTSPAPLPQAKYVPPTDHFATMQSLPEAKFTSPCTGNRFYHVWKSRKFKYTATTSACIKCHSETNRCIPPCCVFQCEKCKLFGHRSHACHQQT